MSGNGLKFDPPRERGPWLVHGEELRFESPWLKLVTYPITQPNSGEPGEYGVVKFKNLALGVLPLDDQGYTWIVGQHRFTLDEYSWELPEGGGDPAVPPETSALRELEEETGLCAATLTPLGRWHTSNSVTDELALAYIATGLSAGTPDPDPSEVLEVRRLKFSALLEMCLSGEISDAFTVLMVQSAWIKAVRGQLPAEICAIIRKSADF